MLFVYKVVKLASESFNYQFHDRMKIRFRRFATEQWPDGIGRRITNDLPFKVSVKYNVLPLVSLYK